MAVEGFGLAGGAEECSDGGRCRGWSGMCEEGLEVWGRGEAERGGEECRLDGGVKRGPGAAPCRACEQLRVQQQEEQLASSPYPIHRLPYQVN